MPSPAISVSAVVVGGGISGLTCAYRLQQAGIAVRVLDAADLPGGLISTDEVDGFRLERGPQSFLLTGALRAFVEELGLTGELLFADSRAPRYIVVNGKLVAAPLVPPTLISSPLLNWKTKWRIFSEMLRSTRPPADEESIATFFRRKFGDELLEKLVAPFVSGIYAGDPEKLSLPASFPKLHEFETKYGSVLRGAMKSRPPKGSPKSGLCSFRLGMATLPRTISSKLGGAYQAGIAVRSIRRAASSVQYRIETTTLDGNTEEITANAVIMATPAYTCGEILRQISEQFSSVLSKISYAPVAVISTGYRREQVLHLGNGFGFLVPRSEGLHVLGTVWNSALFSGCSPEGMALYTSFAGGATDPTFSERTDEQITQTISAEIGKILGIASPAVMQAVHRYPRAIPQYNLGHLQTIAALHGLEKSNPGLFLTGNYLEGPAIGTCVEHAGKVAESISSYLREATAKVSKA